jgi:hypothetical protein
MLNLANKELKYLNSIHVVNIQPLLRACLWHWKQIREKKKHVYHEMTKVCFLYFTVFDKI